MKAHAPIYSTHYIWCLQSGEDTDCGLFVDSTLHLLGYDITQYHNPEDHNLEYIYVSVTLDSLVRI
jgi:hypothetical protein